MFLDREEAGRLLAERLAAYRGRHPLVLAIPRGGVVVGRVVADELEGDLDVVLVRKLRAPGIPELAIGAVDERGQVYLTEAAALKISNSYIDQVVSTERELIRQRRDLYGREPISPEGRIVIVVDDGIATGSTMVAALRATRAARPARLIAAAAVAPPNTIRRLQVEAEEVVCLEAPSSFTTVGEFFRDFHSVSDEEVVRWLK